MNNNKAIGHLNKILTKGGVDPLVIDNSSEYIVAVDRASGEDFSTIGTTDHFIAVLPHEFTLTQEKFDKIFDEFIRKGSLLTAHEVGALFVR